jgi:hypothetical protein
MYIRRENHRSVCIKEPLDIQLLMIDIEKWFLSLSLALSLGLICATRRGLQPVVSVSEELRIWVFDDMH